MSTVKDIEQLLQVYLYQKKTVSLPGIGTFKIERVKPKESESGKYLWGPVHVIKLDSKIDSNSKEIFDFVSRKMNITEWEAIKLLNEFVTNLKSSVRKDATYQMEGFGNLELNDDGSFRLNSLTLQYPFYSRILKPDADLMHSMEEPLNETSEEQLISEEIIEYPNDEVQKDRWWIAIIVFAVVALIIIAISMTRSDIPFGGRQNRTEVQSAPLQYE